MDTPDLKTRHALDPRRCRAEQLSVLHSGGTRAPNARARKQFGGALDQTSSCPLPPQVRHAQFSDSGHGKRRALEHPSLGRCIRNEFIALAEDSGYHSACGWVWRAACRQSMSWRLPLAPMRPFVNFSAAVPTATSFVSGGVLKNEPRSALLELADRSSVMKDRSRRLKTSRVEDHGHKSRSTTSAPVTRR